MEAISGFFGRDCRWRYSGEFREGAAGEECKQRSSVEGGREIQLGVDKVEAM